MIHVDTSFLIRVMDPVSPESRKLRAWIREGETFSISAVAWAECVCGPLSDSEIEAAAVMSTATKDSGRGMPRPRLVSSMDLKERADDWQAA